MLLHIFVVSCVQCGECIVGADGGGCGGIKAAADSNFTHHHIICCTA